MSAVISDIGGWPRGFDFLLNEVLRSNEVRESREHGVLQIEIRNSISCRAVQRQTSRGRIEFQTINDNNIFEYNSWPDPNVRASTAKGVFERNKLKHKVVIDLMARPALETPEELERLSILTMMDLLKLLDQCSVIRSNCTSNYNFKTRSSLRNTNKSDHYLLVFDDDFVAPVSLKRCSYQQEKNIVHGVPAESLGVPGVINRAERRGTRLGSARCGGIPGGGRGAVQLA